MSKLAAVCCSAASLALVVHSSESESRQTSTADDNASQTECKKQSDRHLTLQQRMELAVNASLSKAVVADPAVDVEKSQLAAIRSEMAMFESTGKRGRGLELVYRYLLTIPPSSVDTERAFSAAGVLCTKVRSRLSDKSIDTLCFLCSYYQQNKQ